MMRFRTIIYGLMAGLLAACSDTIPSVEEERGGFEAGEAVLFTTRVPARVGSTKGLTVDGALLDSYQTIQRDYTLSVRMYEKDVEGVLAQCTYKPRPATEPTETNNGFDENGRLAPAPTAAENPLCWPSNVREYGFEAVAGTETLEADQSTQEKWLAQDRLHGYAFMPLLDDAKAEGEQGVDKIGELNYHTNRVWGSYNKTWQEASGEMMQPDDYKCIPLFLQHQRAWITIILRAGEGVKREALDFATAAENIQMTINSYAVGSSTAFPIDKSWASEEFIDYQKDKNGEAESHVSTTRYDAIVEPHNYATNKEEEVIARVNLSKQNFSFYANSDARYKNGTEADKEQADKDYDLQAGKHLTLDVTLSRDSRKILVTAWVEDWTELATSTICDDYGQNGDPVVIKSRDELIAFLTNPKTNRQGSTGIIQPTELVLDLPDDPWTGVYDLHATLNLAGSTLVTEHRMFSLMSSSGNLVNGTVRVADGATVDCAIAARNEGTIERVNVLTGEGAAAATATLAGLVGVNHGTIYRCSSTLPVYGATPTKVADANGTTYDGFVGGIAAVSVSKDGTSMAVIDGCTVNAPVDGAASDGVSVAVRGGGIAGYATGNVSNNTFEYGISVKQDAARFKNIFGEAGAANLRANGNGWPTGALNLVNETSPDSNPNRYSGSVYDAVIASQKELAILMSSAYNVSGKNYRISADFTVESSNDENNDWPYGTVAADELEHTNNVRFNLDGNDKVVTLTGTKTVKTTDGVRPGEGTETTYVTAPMLFNYVLGEIKNLTLYLDKSIVAAPSYSVEMSTYSATDAIAPLAYAVYGSNGKLTNVKVKAHKDSEGVNDVFVQAATPAGLVVWAYGGATITNCKVQVPVRMWLPANMGVQSKHYAGGMVACAGQARLDKCVYLVQTGDAVCGAETSSKAIQSANYYYGGLVGGTSTKGEEEPCLQITDCTSWFIATKASEENPDKSSKGAIIGYTCYAKNDTESKITNGMDLVNKSEGNWWPLSAVGACEWAADLNEEQVIGKRNGVAPSYEADF